MGGAADAADRASAAALTRHQRRTGLRDTARLTRASESGTRRDHGCGVRITPCGAPRRGAVL